MSNYPDDDSNPKPIVHVRSLGEFEYCPRAGIIAFDNQTGNAIDHESIRIPNLGYSPILDLVELNAEIAKKWSRVGKSGFMAIALAIFAYAMGRTIGYPDAIPPWLIALFPASVAYYAAKDLSKLYELWFTARRAGPMQLLHESPRVAVEVDWWELVKAYQVGPFGHAYTDSREGISGKAHRLLSSHRHRIPVILSHSRSENSGVRPTHKIKLAAYAKLISSSEERAICDWGIVIFANTRKGYAVPIDSVDIERAFRKLRSFHRVIEDSSEGKIPSKPHESACQSCHNNVRRIHKKGVTESKVGNRTILPFIDREDDTHCDCGDRFQWRPPLRIET